MTVHRDRIPSERPLLQVLSDFRYQLRSFLQFSERAADQVHLHPQQHQLLLQVAAAPEGSLASIAYAAERLGLRHNSAVELVNRSVAQRLLVRTQDPQDRRRVVLHVTIKGKQIIKKLARLHAQELRELGPRLVRSLKRIERADRAHTGHRTR